MSKPTLRDIAAAAGVSVTSASMILNGRSTRFNEDTVRKVLQAATTMGYTRDSAAAALRTGSYDHIAIIMPDPGPHASTSSYLLDNPFFSDFFAGMEMAAAAPGTLFGLCRASGEQQIRTFLMQRRPRGAVVLGKLPAAIAAEVAAMDIPVVIIDGSEDLPDHVAQGKLIPFDADDERMGKMAMQFLIDSGHRNISLVFGELASSAVHRRRYAGVESAIAEHGRDDIQTRLIETEKISYAAAEGLSRTLRTHVDSGCTAVLCMADILAIGIYKCLTNSGLRIPEQVSLIGMDGLKMLDYLPYRLTTIDQGIVHRGFVASRHLVDGAPLSAVVPTLRRGETVLNLVADA